MNLSLWHIVLGKVGQAQLPKPRYWGVRSKLESWGTNSDLHPQCHFQSHTHGFIAQRVAEGNNALVEVFTRGLQYVTEGNNFLLIARYAMQYLFILLHGPTRVVLAIRGNFIYHRLAEWQNVSV